ncbi:MAG: 16S rRNA (guanine(966)-N(2))-methyltransferase RsmD [Burkholderiales bacterium]|nr:16S rRNA (guanine(966)-N(2))-methyltransferase RsmD [Burkholderiales bacterium]
MHSTRKASSARRAPAARGRVRIIGGQWRGRRIDVLARPALRPTPDRVRETLFNWLGQRLDGLACLDLFAGSGALGFEAASRGAARVVLVERDRAAAAALARTRAALGAAQVEIVRADARAWLARARERFDVVFLDPPFGHNAVPPLLAGLGAVLAPRARVYVEAPAPVAVPAPWRELRRGAGGQVHYQLLEWAQDGGGDDPSGIPGNV